jgi:hypothetical protein
MTVRLDDEGREWAGDFHRQQILTQRIGRLIDGKQVVDIMASLGTVAANFICDIASDEAAALAGLQAHHEDMQRVIRARFTKNAVN